MTLLEVVRTLGSLSEEDTIYAFAPWTETSEAIVAPEPDSRGGPSCVQEVGLKYFLEVFIAREFLEDWAGNVGKEPTLEERCARLIQYAIDDA